MPISKRTRASISIVALATAGSLLLAGCTSAGKPSSTSPPAPVTSIVTAWPADISTLDPHAAASDQEKEIASNVYENLVTYDTEVGADGVDMYKGTDLKPMLASSWDVDGATVTFHLRTDVKFYPTGNPLTAEDVRYSLERSLSLYNSSYNGLSKPSQIKVIDDHTVSFTAEDPSGNEVPITPNLWATWRDYIWAIVDSVEVKKHATTSDPYATKWLSQNTAGSGPYYIANYVKGQEIDLKAVPDQPIPEVAPAIPNVTIKITSGASTLSLLQGGTINAAVYGLSQNDLDTLSKSPDFTVSHAKTPDFNYIQLPSDTGPFSDQRVRQAVAYAIPYDDIVKNVFFGRADRSVTFVNPAASGWSPAWQEYSTDLDKAKSLMQQAGNPSISIPLDYPTSDPYYEDEALLIKSALSQIGITVTLVPHTQVELFTMMTARISGKLTDSPVPILLFSLSVYTDDAAPATRFFGTSNGSQNWSQLKDPQIDQLSSQWIFAAAGADRDAAYKQIQQLAADQAAIIPLVVTGRNVATVKGLANIPVTPEIILRYYLFKSVS